MSASPVGQETLLDRYVTFLVRRKFSVRIFFWIILLVALFVGKDAFGGLENGGFSPPRMEASKAQVHMGQNLIYPDYTIVLMADGSSLGLKSTDAQFQTYYQQVYNSLKSSKTIGAISYYDRLDKRMISDDGSKVLIYATTTGIKVPDLEKIASSTPLKFVVGGTLAWGEDMNAGILKGVETAEFGSLPILFVLLILALGSLMAGFMPWVVALCGIFFTLAMLVGFDKVFRVSGISQSVVTMFGLGLGIDYTLFIVSRFKQERNSYPHVHVTKIIKRTMLTSGRTVMFSAVTVFLALLGGFFFHEFFLASMCLSVSLAAMAAALSANSFLYAQLAILDHKINMFTVPTLHEMAVKMGWAKDDDGSGNNSNANDSQSHSRPQVAAATVIAVSEPTEHNTSYSSESKDKFGDNSPRADDTHKTTSNGITSVAVNASTKAQAQAADLEENGFWFKIGDFVLTHSIKITFLTTAFLIAFTVVYFKLIKWGVTDPDVLPITSGPRVVFDTISTEFKGRGKSVSYVYLRTGKNGVKDPQFLQDMSDFQTNLVNQLGTDNVAHVASMISETGIPNFSLSDYKTFYSAGPASYPQYSALYGYLAFPALITNYDSDTFISIGLNYPQYSDEALDAVTKIRKLLSSSFLASDASTGTSIVYSKSVTGATASILDLQTSIGKELPTWSSVMLISVYVLLLLMTKSIVLPLKAVIVSVLSLGATFGIIVLIFTSHLTSTRELVGIVPTGYIDSSNIIFIASVSFGLSIDYELFLLSVMQEEYKRNGGDLRLAILRAMQRTGGIITSAAIMLAVTTFAFISSTVSFIKLIGVGIAIAVVLDATLIRICLVPSIMLLMGEWNFYCPEPLKSCITWLGLEESEEGLEDLGAEEEAIVTRLVAEGKGLDSGDGVKAIELNATTSPV